MWQLEWAATPPTLDLAHRPPDRTREIGGRQPKRVGGLMWEDHCHESAEPDCYATCPLYPRRGDGRCARLEYGIYPNPAFDGLFPFGADVKIRRWGSWNPSSRSAGSRSDPHGASLDSITPSSRALDKLIACAGGRTAGKRRRPTVPCGSTRCAQPRGLTSTSS